MERGRTRRFRNSPKDSAEESGGRWRQTAGKTAVFVQETRTAPARLTFLWRLDSTDLVSLYNRSAELLLEMETSAQRNRLKYP